MVQDPPTKRPAPTSWAPMGSLGLPDRQGQDPEVWNDPEMLSLALPPAQPAGNGQPAGNMLGVEKCQATCWELRATCWELRSANNPGYQINKTIYTNHSGMKL